MSQRRPERHFNCPRPFAGRDQGEETALTFYPSFGRRGKKFQISKFKSHKMERVKYW